MKTVMLFVVFIIMLPFEGAISDEVFQIDLGAIDEANKISDNFGFEMEVVSIDNGNTVTSQSLNGYVIYDAKEAQVKSMVEFTSPKDVKGRRLLIEGAYIWASFPRTKNLIRLSPLQILMGGVSYGDILRIVYKDYYDVVGFQSVLVNGKETYGIDLKIKDKHKGSGYSQIKLKVDQKSLLISVSEIYGKSGKLIKTARYSDEKKIFGKNINTKVVITDATNGENSSILTYKKLVELNTSNKKFNKNYLNKMIFSDL